MKTLLLTVISLIALTDYCRGQCAPYFISGPDDFHIYPALGQCTGTASFSAPTFTGCPNGILWQTGGLPSGSVFPQGTTTNTFEVMEKLTLFEEDFSDNAAGWTLGTEWQIGPAVTSTCGLVWAQDPGTDNSSTIDNGVAGVAIGGCAAAMIHPFYYITSPVINTSGSNYLGLDLYRWLNSDYAPYMQNRIEVFDGNTWQVIWQTGVSPVTNDDAWTLMNFNIQAYTNAALQVRIGFNVGSAGVFPVGSWNLDDIKIYDLVGTGATYSFNVNVSNQVPVITCPTNITQTNSSGLACSVVVTFSAPSVTGCNPVTTSITSGFVSGSEFPIGTTNVEWTATQILPIYTLFLQEDFSDNSAGWVLGTEWEIGAATVSACGGNPDPGVDHTNTADNGIAGVLLGACATTAVHPYYYMTSPVVDASGSTSLTLEFWRWLNSDVSPNMQNSIEVYDGFAWQLIWQSGATAFTENSWTHEVYDLTAYVNSNLQVRFGHQVSNAGGLSLGSWNIDDLVIYGDKAFSASCTFDVTVGPSQNTGSTSICQGDTLTFGTQMITTSGTYTETWLGGGIGGCDSTVVLSVTENPTHNMNISAQICAGDSLILGSQILNSAGVYTELFASMTGCDSTIVLTLNIVPSYNDTLTQTICQGDSVLFAGDYYNTPGMYLNNSLSMNGCDSSILLFLNISMSTNDTLLASICDGDTYMLGPQSLTTSGIYTGFMSNMYGCDSTVTINLTVESSPTINVNGITDEVYGNDGVIDVQILSANPFSVSWSNGATTEDLSGISGGVYIITVTDNSTECQIVDTVVVNSQAGIGHLVQSNIKLFPNPNDGHFEVQTGESMIEQISIVDNMGRLVDRYVNINEATFKLNVEHLKAGMYQLNIETQHTIFIRNVIIQ